MLCGCTTRVGESEMKQLPLLASRGELATGSGEPVDLGVGGGGGEI